MARLRRYLPALASSVLFCVGHATGEVVRQTAFAPRRPESGSKLQRRVVGIEEPIYIRGGALISKKKKSVVLFVTGVSLFQGAVAYVDPTLACESYGIPSSPLANLIMRRLGVVLLQMGILSLGVLFLDDDHICVAIGTASLGFIAEISRSMLKNEHTTLGFALGPQIFVLLECLAVALVNLSNHRGADAVNKFHAIWTLFNGLLFALAPTTVLKVGWGLSSLDSQTVGMVSGFGYWCVAYAVYLAGIAWGTEGIKALTWSRLAILLIHFLPSQGESIGMDKSKQIALLAYQAVAWAALAF